MTKMNPTVKARWVEKLREPGLPQTKGALNRPEPDGSIPQGFCCLGVLCEIAVEEGVVARRVHPRSVGYGEQGNIGVLPVEVEVWAGLDSCDPSWIDDELGRSTLSSRNDNGTPFAELADIIEKEL